MSDLDDNNLHFSCLAFFSSTKLRPYMKSWVNHNKVKVREIEC